MKRNIIALWRVNRPTKLERNQAPFLLICQLMANISKRLLPSTMIRCLLAHSADTTIVPKAPRLDVTSAIIENSQMFTN